MQLFEPIVLFDLSEISNAKQACCLCLVYLHFIVPALEPEDSQNKRRQLSGPFLSHLTANQRGFSLAALAPRARCEIYITVLFTCTNMTSLFIFTSRSE